MVPSTTATPVNDHVDELTLPLPALRPEPLPESVYHGNSGLNVMLVI